MVYRDHIGAFVDAVRDLVDALFSCGSEAG